MAIIIGLLSQRDPGILALLSRRDTQSLEVEAKGKGFSCRV